MNNKLIPVVSIIIPTYNQAKYIGKALQSIIDQTFKNWEAIVIDNHSTDGTQKILNQFVDPRIKCLKINNNGIIAKSRNLGIKFAKGEWIAFLDSDDWWTKDKLKICSSHFSEKVDLIYHDLEIVTNKSKIYKKKKINKGRQLKKPILRDLLIGLIKEGNAIGNSSVIVRRRILLRINGINESKKLVASEDFNTWLRIAQITDQFKYIQRTLGYYLINDFSSQKKNLSIPHKFAVKDFVHLLNRKDKLALEAKWRYMSGSFNFEKKNYFQARLDFVEVLKIGSINLKFRSLIKILLTFIK